MKVRILQIALLALVAIIFTSCIRRPVEMTSYTHPNYFNKTYSRICVLVEGRTLAERKFYENIIVRELNSQGANATEGSILFPPIEEWTEEYYNSVLNKNGYDAFLLVNLSEEVVRDELIPKVVTSTNTKVDNDTTKKKTNTTTSVSTHKEMQRILVIDMQMQMKIVDVKSNQVSWQGESVKYRSGEVGMNNFANRIRYLATDLVLDLQNKNHLVRYD